MQNFGRENFDDSTCIRQNSSDFSTVKVLRYTVHFKPKSNANGGNINIAMSFMNKVALLSTRPHTVCAWVCYIVVIPWELVYCLIYIPLALGLWVYISVKPFVPMV